MSSSINIQDMPNNVYLQAAAVAAIGAGMARVSAIRSTEFQGRAAGGSVIGGQPYLVGERGPEVIVPHNQGKSSGCSQQFKNF